MLHPGLQEAQQTFNHLQISSADDLCITRPRPHALTGKFNPGSPIYHVLREHGNAMHGLTPANHCDASARKDHLATHARPMFKRSSLCRSPGKAEVRPALLSRPQVSSWIERELQALLLDSDVSIVVQHILGSLRAAFPASVNCKR